MIYHKYVHIDAIKCFSWIILSMVIIGSLLKYTVTVESVHADKSYALFLNNS